MSFIFALARDAVYDIVDQSVKEAKIARGPGALMEGTHAAATGCAGLSIF